MAETIGWSCEQEQQRGELRVGGVWVEGACGVIAMLTAATRTKRRWETSCTPRSARFSEVYPGNFFENCSTQREASRFEHKESMRLLVSGLVWVWELTHLVGERDIIRLQLLDGVGLGVGENNRREGLSRGRVGLVVDAGDAGACGSGGGRVSLAVGACG